MKQRSTHSIEKIFSPIGAGGLLLCGILMAPHPFIITDSPVYASQENLRAIRGVVRPKTEAVLSSEIQGRIIQLPFQNGERFKKGDTLVEFGCAQYRAEWEVAQAEYESREKTLENNLELLALDAIGHLDVEIAKVDLKKARALRYISRVNMAHCKIKAPFSGRVVSTLVHRFETVNRYDELLSILDDQDLEIDLIMPSLALEWIKKGSAFRFRIDETKQTLPAKISNIGARIDPVSQTVMVTGVFSKKSKRLLAGMSGQATFLAINTKTPEIKKRRLPKEKPSSSVQHQEVTAYSRIHSQKAKLSR